jgi:putative phosphoesterase
MRIAVVADIHGNVPALRATLAEIDAEHVDAVVVCGDTAAGPFVTPSLEMLATRPEPVHWVRGNGERETVACFDGVELADASSGWAPRTARELDCVWRDRMASWPIALELDGVCFCHGSPRADDEILTRATPPEVLAAAIGGTSAGLIIGGHTHQQFIRALPDGRVVVNAGGVGLPYEGRAGAFWMMVSDRRPELRETRYDVPAAADELRASGFPDLDDAIRESLLEPVDPAWATAFFEHEAGRGEHPGDPRRAPRQAPGLAS